MIEEKHLNETKKDKYISDMLQEDENEDDDDDDLEFSCTSVNKYQVKLSYKDFSIDFLFPVYSKPVIDKEKKADIIFELLINRATHFFLLATDEEYKAEWKKEIKEVMKKQKELEVKKYE